MTWGKMKKKKTGKCNLFSEGWKHSNCCTHSKKWFSLQLFLLSVFCLFVFYLMQSIGYRNARNREVFMIELNFKNIYIWCSSTTVGDAVQQQCLVGLQTKTWERKTTNMANVTCCYIQSCTISRNGWIYNMLVIHAADALIKKSSCLI